VRVSYCWLSLAIVKGNKRKGKRDLLRFCQVAFGNGQHKQWAQNEEQKTCWGFSFPFAFSSSLSAIAFEPEIRLCVGLNLLWN